MPSNILNKISEKLGVHDSEDHPSESQQHQSSKGYQSNQPSRTSDDTDLGDYQSNSRTRGTRSGNTGYGEQQRGGFTDDTQGISESWDSGNTMNSRGQTSNAGMRTNDRDEYGQSSNSYRGTSSQEAPGINSYKDDEYGSSRSKGTSSRGMGDTIQSAAQNEYVQKGVDQGKDFVSNNM